MAREIPEVVRAVAGLAVTVLDEARKLPVTLPGLPVRLIGQLLQTSLKVQQHYSGLVARGDELFTGLRGDDGAGLATFDDDLPEAAPAINAGPRTSPFDRVAAPPDTIAEELADELADDLAVADLPVADPDDISDEATAAVLVETLAADADDMSAAEVALLPDDPAADAITAVVDELAADVVDEVATEVPDAVPDEVLEDLVADTGSEVAEAAAAVEEAVEEAVVEAAVADEVIADAAVDGTPPAPSVHTVEDLTDDQAPEQTELVDDVQPDVAALEDAAEELVDLGGPEAAESATPGSDVTDSAASEPLVAPGPPAATDQPATDQPTGDQAATDQPATDQPTGDQPTADQPTADTAPETGPTSPVEGYDSFSIPALRGRLRAYPAETVADLLDYERATRARAPYVTLLQNRLEKLSIDRG